MTPPSCLLPMRRRPGMRSSPRRHQANPGQFVYNRPDKGGSGGNFVRRAIHQANGLDPKAFTVDNYTEAFGNEALGKAWEILKDIAPSLYDNGAYSSGNTQSIQLLAQGVVTMTPVWSDQVLQAIAQGVLPETTGIVQLQDLALCGNFSRAVVLSNGRNRDAALKLADFILTEEIQGAILSETRRLPGRQLGICLCRSAREVCRHHPEQHPDLPVGRLGGCGQRWVVSQRGSDHRPEVVSASVTTSGLSKSTSGRGLVGLLLVALPVSLVAWLVIWPIISAIVRTVWRSSRGGGRLRPVELHLLLFRCL